MTKPITLVQDEAPEITNLKKSRKKIYIGIAAVTAIAATGAVLYVINKRDPEDCDDFREQFIEDIENLVAATDIPNE